MNFLKIIFLSLIIFIKSLLFGQSIDKELENKYWNYKDRLNKYFVQIGPHAGQSLTAAQITSNAL